MKKLAGLKNINETFTNSINGLFSELQNNIKEIKHEYQQNVIEEKFKLLLAVCNGEGLNFDEIKIKYLKPKELDYFDNNEPNKNTISIDDNLLDKITVNGQDYYCESINGVVFNTNNQPVGIYKNGTIIFNKN
jgi:hypothetical protein